MKKSDPALTAAITHAEEHLRDLQSRTDSQSGEFHSEQDSLETSPFPNLISAYSVPIEIPSRSTMSVRLVPIDWLDRFEEYKDKESEFLAILFCLLGTILAVLVNVFTSDVKLSTHFWGFMAILGMGSLYFVRSYFQVRARVKQLKGQMSDAFAIVTDGGAPGSGASPVSKAETDYGRS